MRVRISARQSDLARLQAYRVGEALKSAGATSVEYNFRASLGDLNQNDPLWKMPEKGVFTEDFLRDLTEGTADMVVHSWKDLPTMARPDTEIVATLPRADTRDLLLFRRDRLAQAMESGVVRILTSSPRRSHNLGDFLLTHLPQNANGLQSVTFEPVRGNIPTRLKKLMSQDVDGLILAKAALDRLMAAPEPEFAEAQAVIRDVLAHSRFMVLPHAVNPTAAAQGALAIEIPKHRPELVELVSRFNCTETFEAVSEERKILAAYGGGCHQKIGVTILHRPFGKLTYLRGLTDAGEVLDHIELQSPLARVPLTAEEVARMQLFPANNEEGSFFDRELITGSELEGVLGKLSGAQAIWVARENAWPFEYQAAVEQVVWSAGLKTWRKLASRGIWVNGSAEGLGEQEPRRLDVVTQNPQLDWVKLSHEDAHRTSSSVMRSVATYRLRPKARLPDLRERTHFFWMSGSSYERAVALFPEIKAKHHASGPGHTHTYLAQVLGEEAVQSGQLSVALDVESWRRSLQGASAAASAHPEAQIVPVVASVSNSSQLKNT